jgi:hypothetical protein
LLLSLCEEKLLERVKKRIVVDRPPFEKRKKRSRT